MMPNYGKRRANSGRNSRRHCYISADFCRSVVGECLCTFFFMIIVCGMDLNWNKTGDENVATAPDTLRIAITLGFAGPSLEDMDLKLRKLVFKYGQVLQMDIVIEMNGMESNSLGIYQETAVKTVAHDGVRPKYLIHVAQVYIFTVLATVATLIQCFEHISGAHMNPAVTIAMMILQHTGIAKGVLYMVAQTLGAALAVVLMHGFLPLDIQGSMGFAVWSDKVGPHQALGVEATLTFILAFTIVASQDPRRHLSGLVALPVGVAFLTNTLWAYEFTGASMNPVRTIPSALLITNNDKMWLYIFEIYLLGPILGAIAAAIIYKYIFDPNTGSSIRSVNSSFYDYDDHMVDTVGLQTISSHANESSA